MEKDRISTLLDKYRNDKITDEERAFLESWYAQYQEPGSDYDPEHLLDDSEQVKKALRRSGLHARRKKYLPQMAAAVVLIALAAGFYFYPWKSPPGRSDHTETIDDIFPGGNKATLILADGKTIDLSADKEGIIIGKDKLVYNDGTVAAPAPVKDSLITRYAILSTPRGGQYQLRLPDGTRVWLNAASSLKYPTSFDGLKERRVVLSGEAYFEVARDQDKSFLVATEKQTVVVLGTHFNINCYRDEPGAKTTLLEGSLRVTSLKAGGAATDESRLLQPGQQAVLLKNGMTVKAVDTDEAVAWKNGYFQFNNKNLETAMTELARWYDVAVEYKDKAVRGQELAGTISKYSSISQVLKKMELTGVMRFSIAGRTVTVEKVEKQDKQR